MEPNTTQTPNYYYDVLLPLPLTLAELKIINAVIRETYGWGEPNWEMSINDLVKKTGLERANVTRAAARLCMGSDRLPALLGRKLNSQGTYVYWLLVEKSKRNVEETPAAVVSQRHPKVVSQRHPKVVSQHGPPKEERKILKEKTEALKSSSSMHLRETKPDDDDHKSRFDLDTIRKYAEHLHTTKARAVRNVEGLALSMFKTGADDSRISDWLAKSLAESRPKPEDPYAVFRRIVGLSLDLAKTIRKSGPLSSARHNEYREGLIESGAILENEHYWLLHELAVIRLESKHLGLPDELVEAKRKQFHTRVTDDAMTR